MLSETREFPTMRSIMHNKTGRIIFPLISLIFWLGLWEILAVVLDMGFILPTPIAVIRRVFTLFRERNFYTSVLGSLSRITGGYILGIMLGILFGALMHCGRICHDIIAPMITVIKSTPVASFILILWVLCGSDALPGIISALIVLPIVSQNIYTGISHIDGNLVEVCRLYGFGPLKKLRTFYIPSLYPYFSSAAILGLGMAWKAGVAAEVLAYVKNSVGKEIYRAKSMLETVDLFAYTMVIIVISLVLESTIKMIFGRSRKTGNVGK